MPSRGRAKAISAALDSINRRYGNNTLYFGAMQEALAQEAAPMRIPFSTIPQAGLEEDVTAKRPAADSAEELWLQRERQFKVLAELAHRQAQAAGKDRSSAKTVAYGAGGWVRQAPDVEDGAAREPRSGSLF